LNKTKLIRDQINYFLITKLAVFFQEKGFDQWKRNWRI